MTSSDNLLSTEDTVIISNKHLRLLDNIFRIHHLPNDLRNELGMLESSDNYTKLTEKGGGIGALGRYQLRGPGLQDIGYVKKDENKNYHWLGKNNIYSTNDFLNNPEIQERALDEFMKVQQRYLKHYGSWDYIGTPIDGIEADFNVTDTGLLAAAHRGGYGPVRDYLNALDKNENGQYYMNYNNIKNPETEAMFRAVETRLRKFEK